MKALMMWKILRLLTKILVFQISQLTDMSKNECCVLNDTNVSPITFLICGYFMQKRLFKTGRLCHGV